MKRLTLIPILTVLLVGCGGGGGSGSGSTPPPTQQSFAGMWTGTDSNGFPITAYSTDSGEFFWKGNVASHQTGTGVGVSIAGDSVIMTLSLLNPLRYVDGSISANCTASGTFDERSNIALSGACLTRSGSSFDLSIIFTYDDRYERGSSLNEIAGMYREYPFNDVWTIDSMGVLFVQMADLGCVVNGQVSVIDPQWSAYGMSVMYSNCSGPWETFNDIAMTGTLFLTTDGGRDQIMAIFSGAVMGGTVSRLFFAERI